MFRRQRAREILARYARNTFCDTYDAGRGLNLQADHGRIADYKVVENLRQAGPNVISEVTHEFIGYFFPTPRSIPHLARSSVFLRPLIRTTLLPRLFRLARLARSRSRVPFGKGSEGCVLARRRARVSRERPRSRPL